MVSSISPNLFGGAISMTSARLPSTSKMLEAKTPETEFLEFALKTPAERIRDAVLDELGIIQDSREAMGPEMRDLVEKQIGEKLKEKLAQDLQRRPGMIVDVSA